MKKYTHILFTPQELIDFQSQILKYPTRYFVQFVGKYLLRIFEILFKNYQIRLETNVTNFTLKKIGFFQRKIRMKSLQLFCPKSFATGTQIQNQPPSRDTTSVKNLAYFPKTTWRTVFRRKSKGVLIVQTVTFSSVQFFTFAQKYTSTSFSGSLVCQLFHTSCIFVVPKQKIFTAKARVVPVSPAHFS